MGRPRKKTTEDDCWSVGAYFLEKMRQFEPECLHDPEYKWDADKQLQKIMYSNPIFRERRGLQVNALNAWCRRWITQEGMGKMWTALRQQQHHDRHKPRAINLERKVHFRLREYAEQQELTLSQAVEKLLNWYYAENED